MEDTKKVIIGFAVAISVLILLGIIIAIINSNEPIRTNSSSYTGSPSSGSSYSGGSSSGSSYTGSPSSGSSYSGGSSSSSYYNPADYDSKGNYKPVESMTQQEKKDELTQMLRDAIR